MVKVRRSHNTIKSFYTLEGRKLTSLPELESEAVHFYQNLLGAVDTNCKIADSDWLKDLLHFQLPSAVCDMLIQPIAVEEIKGVIFHSPSNKAPGLDGYTLEFYTVAWPVVGELVTKAI
ncbi:hypothetical protein SLE2022_327570 [Rubroshorea leprosula]